MNDLTIIRKGCVNLSWKRLLNLRKNEIIGLDIGSYAVKIVALRKKADSGYTLTAANITEILSSEENNDTQTINTTRAIRECYRQAGAKRKLAVCGVSGPDVAVRDFEFPSLSNEEIVGAVRLEASQVCPFNTADSAIDYQLINDTATQRIDGKTRGVLVAATNTLVKSKVQFAKAARLNCVLMDIDGLALLNCFDELTEEHEKPQAGYISAILNVGASHTTLAINGDNNRPFIRDLAYGGNNIVEQIAIEKNMTIEMVQKALFAGSESTKTELHDSMNKACRKLFADVSETLRFYATQAKLKRIDKILSCGGFSLTAGFVELLNNHMGIDVVLWNPLEKINCDKSKLHENILAASGPAMVIAAGLAMRTI